MSKEENAVLREVWLAIGIMSRMFRLNTGRGWVPTQGKVTIDPNGDAIVPGGRPIALGYAEPSGKPVIGAGDLVGWTTVTITPEMVGCEVAVYTNIETKSSSEAKKRAAQEDMIDLVKRSGGIAGFAHTPEMAMEIVRGFAPIRKKA